MSGPGPEICDGLGAAVPNTVGGVASGAGLVVLGRHALFDPQERVLSGLLMFLNFADVVTPRDVFAVGGALLVRCEGS